MRNFVQPADVVTVIAPYPVTSGQGVLVGAIFGIAATDAAMGAPVEVKRQGVFDITALGTDVAAAGTKVYWDNGNRRLTTTVGANLLVGATTAAKSGVENTARTLLDGVIR